MSTSKSDPDLDWYLQADVVAVLDPYGGGIQDGSLSAKQDIKEEIFEEASDYEWMPVADPEVSWDVLMVPPAGQTEAWAWVRQGMALPDSDDEGLVVWEAPDKEGLREAWREVCGVLLGNPKEEEQNGMMPAAKEADGKSAAMVSEKAGGHRQPRPSQEVLDLWEAEIEASLETKKRQMDEALQVASCKGPPQLPPDLEPPEALEATPTNRAKRAAVPYQRPGAKILGKPVPVVPSTPSTPAPLPPATGAPGPPAPPVPPPPPPVPPPPPAPPAPVFFGAAAKKPTVVPKAFASALRTEDSVLTMIPKTPPQEAKEMQAEESDEERGEPPPTPEEQAQALGELTEEEKAAADRFKQLLLSAQSQASQEKPFSFQRLISDPAALLESSKLGPTSASYESAREEPQPQVPKTGHQQSLKRGPPEPEHVADRRSKLALCQFLSRFLGRGISPEDVAYTTEAGERGFRSTVALCLRH
ncbi:unnamed protein product [Effrenium voratum]|nr:unnamed protein product [Effrenium voratum]